MEKHECCTSSIEREHYKMAYSLAKDGDRILENLDAEKAHLWHMASALMGEAGELFDAIKQHVIYNKELDLENVMEELGDMEFYMAELRRPLLISRHDTLSHNLEKLSERYGKDYEYSDQKAQDRQDKVNS